MWRFRLWFSWLRHLVASIQILYFYQKMGITGLPVTLVNTYRNKRYHYLEGYILIHNVYLLQYKSCINVREVNVCLWFKTQGELTFWQNILEHVFLNPYKSSLFSWVAKLNVGGTNGRVKKYKLVGVGKKRIVTCLKVQWGELLWIRIAKCESDMCFWSACSFP
jgi:hypothetical protein